MNSFGSFVFPVTFQIWFHLKNSNLEKYCPEMNYCMEVAHLSWEHNEDIIFTYFDGGSCAGLKINLHKEFKFFLKIILFFWL